VALAVTYVVLAVYGSLVPLDFRPFPMAEAWTRFGAIPYLDLGPGSRADWVSNIVLFVPVGFLWAAALWPRLGGAARVGAIVVAAAISAAIALGLEFAQQFFPPRTVSLNDLLAEGIGALVGIAVWALWGRALTELWAEVAAGTARAMRAFLVLYLLAYVAVSLFPYDLVLSAEELSWKLDGGAVVAFLDSGCARDVRCLAKLAAEVLAMVPVGMLFGLARRRKRTILAASIAGALIGLGIETAQFFILSGVSQGASILTRAVGGGLGAAVVPMLAGLGSRRGARVVKVLAALATPPYLIALAVLAGWKLTTPVDIDDALARLDAIRFIPFYYHYYTSEATALASLIKQALFYAPVGALLWAWGGGGRNLALVAAGLAATLAAVIETGRLLLSPLRPDPSNLIVAALAAAVTYLAITALIRCARVDSPVVRRPHR